MSSNLQHPCEKPLTVMFAFNTGTAGLREEKSGALWLVSRLAHVWSCEKEFSGAKPKTNQITQPQKNYMENDTKQHSLLASAVGTPGHWHTCTHMGVTCAHTPNVHGYAGPGFLFLLTCRHFLFLIFPWSIAKVNNNEICL